jgi:hypothetical protein
MTARAPDGHALVRQYDGGATLLVIPGAAGPLRVLVDCGAPARRPLGELVARIVADVTEEDGTARLDVVAATGADRVAGFAEPAWAAVEVGELWAASGAGAEVADALRSSFATTPGVRSLDEGVIEADVLPGVRAGVLDRDGGEPAAAPAAGGTARPQAPPPFDESWVLPAGDPRLTKDFVLSAERRKQIEDFARKQLRVGLAAAEQGGGLALVFELGAAALRVPSERPPGDGDPDALFSDATVPV